MHMVSHDRSQTCGQTGCSLIQLTDRWTDILMESLMERSQFQMDDWMDMLTDGLMDELHE